MDNNLIFETIEKIWASAEARSHIADYKRHYNDQLSGETHYDGCLIGMALDNELDHFKSLGFTLEQINWIITCGIERCWDDSCDGGHCSKCGCHFMEWSARGICQSCQIEIEQTNNPLTA